VKVRRLWMAGLMFVLAGGVASRLNAEPYAVFVVHCEPLNAVPRSFLDLLDMVVKADQQQVRLTIDFTPPWAQMILANPGFLNSVTQWQQAGHELGVHHHPYWVSETQVAVCGTPSARPQPEATVSWVRGWWR